MEKNNIVIDYDEEADVLYLSFDKPKKAVTEEIDNIGIRIDENTNEVVGITILGFLENLRKNKQIKVSI